MAKLVHDRNRIRLDAHDTYAAYDFFVTAWHILDWMYPDPSEASIRRSLRDENSILQIADHVANGAKHFVLTNKRHTSVSDIEDRDGAFSANAFSSMFSADAFAFDGLHVRLSSGKLETVSHLADQLVEFWEAHLPPQ
ncbi:hypothetical protein [Gemmatimonas groenlandica]|uniref:Uncharacterized protein n=1 Tax=Gemmatimonas groenlandica TaxID=2732249 RepID=A0A6M4IQU4_9BACT|nr:hypothetical protein [Gemmatimonas groenlandica]QJR35212.1 hypothetical protein HKW67_06695 [Gemmatimonas groenlandica]